MIYFGCFQLESTGQVSPFLFSKAVVIVGVNPGCPGDLETHVTCYTCPLDASRNQIYLRLFANVQQFKELAAAAVVSQQRGG